MKIQSKITIFCLSLLLASCVKEEIIHTDKTNPIEIKASISEKVLTKAEESPVKDGEYSISLWNTTALCNFLDGVGKIFLEDKLLVWNDIGYENKYTFLLDNVQNRNNYKTDDSKFVGVIFSEEEKKQYQAGIGNETNDLLWGENNSVKWGDVIKFNLYHCMSRVSVWISGDNIDGLAEGQDVNISLTQMILQPDSFNRLTGDVLLNENPKREKLSWKSGALRSIIDEQGQKWLSTSNYLILPPQNLDANKSNHPWMYITVGEKNYSGPINSSMLLDEDGTPVTLGFLPGHHLTIRAKLVDEEKNPIIEFMPAVVKDWEYKGIYPVTSRQVGIYDKQDFIDMVNEFNQINSNSLENVILGLEALADKYGILYKSENDYNLHINLFNNITFENNEFVKMKINNKLYPISLDIEFHGYTITNDNSNYNENDSFSNVLFESN